MITTNVALDIDEKSHKGMGVSLGTRNPERPKQVWVKCDLCSVERYTEIYWHLWDEVESSGWIKRCLSCAVKVKQRERRKNPVVVLPTGSTVYLNVRPANDPNRVLVQCGVCGQEHYEYIRPWRRSREVWKGFCEGCEPWARAALRPERAVGSSAERDAIYAKIRNIRRVLEGDTKQSLRGARMPFCVLAQKWHEQHPQINAATRGTQLYNVKLLSFYFADTPISEINLEMGMEFREYLLQLPPTRGDLRSTTRSDLSVNQTLQLLRRIISYAWEERWVRENPFPVGGQFTPSRRVRKPTPLVTVDEEGRLLSACNGARTYLREVLICLMDTGMHESARQKLGWADIDLDAVLIKGSGCPMKMTPRLHAAMQTLWDSSDRNHAELVWGSKNIKKDLGLARLAAELNGLHLSYFRPTAAWRMARAGHEFEQIAAVLGCKDFNYVRQYLETDPDAAQREINSPLFKQFISEQFGGSAKGNGDGQKNGNAAKKSRGGAHNVKWTPELRARFLALYQSVLEKVQRADASLPEDVRAKALLRGNKPSEVARDYAARTLGVKRNNYLEQVLIKARAERDSD